MPQRSVLVTIEGVIAGGGAAGVAVCEVRRVAKAMSWWVVRGSGGDTVRGGGGRGGR